MYEHRSDNRKNIVFIHAESMDGRLMGCMGHPAMQNATPNLDRLARGGTLFSNAYATSPVCNPSRASVWSGKYPHYYECWNNHEGLKADVPTFRDIFERAGYRTAAVGPLDYAWGKHSIRDRVGSWTRAAKVLRPLERQPLPSIIADDTVPYEGDRRNTATAIARLKEAAGGAEPFLLYLTTELVHPPYRGYRKYMDMISPARIDIPPGTGVDCDSLHPVDRYMRITKNCSAAFPEWLVRQIRHIYFSMIAALDEMVGRVLDALTELNMIDNTFIVFSSDHGEMAGEHNQILKRSMYEPSIHVPLIISGPDVRPGAVVEPPVSLIDIYPTLLDMGGLQYEDYADGPRYPGCADGQSLMPFLSGQAGTGRGWAFAEYHGDRNCTGSFMLRKGPWKYMKHAGFRPQLFNIKDDPAELHDLAAEEHETARKMDHLLLEHFDCGGIDARAKRYDREMFGAWREEQMKKGAYREQMARIYSGFDHLCIQDIMPWREQDEETIMNWLSGKRESPAQDSQGEYV